MVTVVSLPAGSRYGHRYRVTGYSFISLFIVGDVVPPVIQGCPLPPNLAIMASLPPAQDMVTVPALTVTDNSDDNPMVIRVPDSNSFPAGITPVSVTATDASGNIATCAYNVEVSSRKFPILAFLYEQNYALNLRCNCDMCTIKKFFL